MGRIAGKCQFNRSRGVVAAFQTPNCLDFTPPIT
jgi:hypothetical protein